MFDFSLFVSSLPRLAQSLPITLELFVAVVIVGLLIGVPVGLVGQSSSKLVRNVVAFYIGAFRGTPALVQLFFVYYGLGQFDLVRHSFVWPVFRDPFYCAVIALGLNSGAYTARITMGALIAVPKGIIEGAQALGLPGSAILTRIKTPLAVRIALPAYANETILNLKATSLASTKLLVSETYAPYEIFVAAGVIYLAMTFIVAQTFRILEQIVERRTGRVTSDVPKSRRRAEPVVLESSKPGGASAA
jgi:His/Glu/Gln/Arg/opine family amino acid ABC transporter permease subunit